MTAKKFRDWHISGIPFWEFIFDYSLETLLHRQGVRPSESDIFPHRISSLAKNPKLDPVELIQGEKERENEPQGADSLPHGLSIMPSELQTPEPVQELQINPDHGNKIGSKKSEVILPRASVTSPFEDEDDETHQVIFRSFPLTLIFRQCEEFKDAWKSNNSWLCVLNRFEG